MKKLLLLLFLAFPFTSFAQNEPVKELTKFEEFVSKTGSMIKFVDVNLPPIVVKYVCSLECSVRTILSSAGNTYFYFMDKKETSNSLGSTAMIEYSDLVEINKAIIKLQSEVDSDCSSNPDYLENKFTTEDGFEVGYYVSNGKATWFLKLERYKRSSVFVKDITKISDNFKLAQAKIEELKLKE